MQTSANNRPLFGKLSKDSFKYLYFRSVSFSSEKKDSVCYAYWRRNRELMSAFLSNQVNGTNIADEYDELLYAIVITALDGIPLRA